MPGLVLLVVLSLAGLNHNGVVGECLSNPEFNDYFASLTRDDAIPQPGSCCMQDVCGLECPVGVSEPAKGYGIAVIIVVIISVLVGIATIAAVKGRSVNYFVAGRSLPLWMVSITLASQSVDSNALLGNVDLSYRYSFYDGAVIPIGLVLSLTLNAIFLAHHINAECVLTLPDVFARRYGRVVEVLVSMTTVCSFLMLLAGNLVGFGTITGYVWGIDEAAAIWVAAGLIWVYTFAGGLFSVAYTDVVQGIIGWTGCLVLPFYMIARQNPNAPPPSIGFPLYIYPDNAGDGGACDMYSGVPCENYPDKCCYNAALWCPNGTDAGCDRYDRGAYPYGDQPVYSDQMTSSRALSPFPNAIFWNWATILILGIGNLAALDFQARCMAAKTPSIARWGCFFGGLFTVFIGIPFSYMGSITRVYYGPDSIYSTSDADTCAIQLGLPTCALWVPDNDAFLKFLTHDAPSFLGGWCLVGIICASMSTACGAILAMGTVVSHNVVRQLDVWFPWLITTQNLLTVSRVMTLPFTIISTLIAAYYHTSKSSAGATGYLLIVAFDVVLATTVVPLFGCFYAKSPSPRAALVSIIGGALCRVTLEFALPKDGFLLLPFDSDEFLDVGPAASTLYPTFFDVPQTDYWNPSTEPCQQEQFKDYTGVDSLSSFLCCLILFTSIQAFEHYLSRPLFNFSGSEGYDKDTTEHPSKAVDDSMDSIKKPDGTEEAEGKGKVDEADDDAEA